MPWSKVGPNTGHSRGMDISSHQKPVRINWNIIKNVDKIKFVYIRTSYKTESDYKLKYDTAAAAHIKRAKGVGLPVGFYHFTRIKTGIEYDPMDAIRDAQFFIRAIRKHMRESGYSGWGDLIPVLDLENVEIAGSSTPQIAKQIVDWAWNFSQYITKETGRRVMIYTCPFFFEDDCKITPQMNVLKKLPLWVAHYTQENCPKEFGGWPDWAVWQYTQDGLLQGYKIGEGEHIEEHVDLNWGPRSLNVLMRPTVPRDLFAAMSSNGEAVLTWSRDKESDVLGYMLHTYINGYLTNSIMTPYNSFVIKGLPREGIYSFSLQAVSQFEASALSEIVSLTHMW